MGLATDKIDALFSKYANDDSPGCAVALIDDGQIVYHRCYGMADLEKAYRLRRSRSFI